MATVTLDINLVAITCCNSECGITFAVPEHWQRQKRRDHSWWYCPNGHHQHYPAQSDIEKAKAEAEQLRSRLAAAKQNAKYHRAERERVERSRSAIKGQLTKVKNRVAKGVCPCCNRHFENLHRHMETKHPEYATST